MIRLSTLTALILAATLSAQTEIRKPANLPSYKDLKFAPLPPVKIPEPVTVALPNGMKLYLLEDHELPLVTGVALIRTGNLFDPPTKRGLATITGDVLRSGGTKSKTGDQIDLQLENLAASVESNIGESSATISFSALRENTGEVMALFKDLLTAPEFRQEKIDLEKKQIRSSIARRNDDAEGITGREFSALLYGRDTPYGWNIEYEHIDRIQRQDVLDFYRRYYFPSNVLLAVYGDFDANRMKDELGKLFADWTAKQPPVPAFPAVGQKATPGVFLATKPDVTQTFFSVGHLGGIYKDKDYPALEVASQILGGGFSSRLFQRVRTKLGYAYNIGAGWGVQYDHPGMFTISGSTQSVHTVDTLKAVREELDKIRNEPVSSQELQTAKDTVLNGFVFNFDRPSKTLNRLLLYEYYGYPRDFIFQYQKAIAAVTQADILRVAKQYFRPQDLTIVATGNPAEFKTPLGALGLKVENIDLTIPAPPKAAVKADPAQGKALLAKMQTAMGGAGKLAAVKDTQYAADVAVSTGPGGGSMKAKQRNFFIQPSAMRQDMELPFGKQSVFFDGQTGWLATPQGIIPMAPPVVKQIQGELFREFLSLALSDRIEGRTVTAIAPDTLEISAGPAVSARIQLNSDGLPVKLSYDAESGNPAEAVEQTFSDWREVGGVKAPFASVIFRGGQKFADVKLTEYKVNSGLTLETLSKKP